MTMKIPIAQALDECLKELKTANLHAVAKHCGVPQPTLFRLVNHPGYKPLYETIRSIVKYIEETRERGEEIPQRRYKLQRTKPATAA